MIIKRLLRAWDGGETGSVVVIEDDQELVARSVVGPTAEVRQLIRDWEAPSGVTVVAGTKVQLDEATAKALDGLGMLDPSVI